jgi:cellulose synthase/poly-beta-1,6-N-acetylglucosamine synthase-like glycosyltransferase
MSAAAAIFLISIALIVFAYAGYPLLIHGLAAVLGRPIHRSEPRPSSISVVIAAHNEAACIQRRIAELQRLLAALGADSEILVVSDGSTDGTDRLAEAVADARTRVIRHPWNLGKAVALNTGVDAARHGIVVFADARQVWDDNTIPRMLENFRDPKVGAVSGDLVLRNEDGSLAGVGLYWKIEKWLRLAESRLYSSVQVAGAVCALRRCAYVPMSSGTILDDVCWPLDVVMQGYRIMHEPTAQAFDRLPDRPRDELRRKVRTLSGNLQLVALRPGILLPWRNPVWYAVLGHKLLRLLVPWAMIAALLACALGARDAQWLAYMLTAQVAGYALAVAGLLVKPVARLPLVSPASSLLLLNTAALLAWWVYFTGQTRRSWKKVTYQPSAPVAAAG